MRRIRIIMDSAVHTSEIIAALAKFQPQYLIFGEESLGDEVRREDTLPPGLVMHTELQPEVRKLIHHEAPKKTKKQLTKDGLYYRLAKEKRNASLGITPKNGRIIRRPRPDGYGEEVDIDASLETFGLTREQLLQWTPTQGTDLMRLKNALIARKRSR